MITASVEAEESTAAENSFEYPLLFIAGIRMVPSAAAEDEDGHQCDSSFAVSCCGLTTTFRPIAQERRSGRLSNSATTNSAAPMGITDCVRDMGMFTVTSVSPASACRIEVPCQAST